jgi:hypothetical protein
MKSPCSLRGLSFALFAGLSAVPWQLLWAPVVGWNHALSALLLALTVIALPWNAPSPRAAVAAALLAGVVLGPLGLLGLPPSAAMLAGACMLAVGRSGLCYPRPFARALAVELCFTLCAGGVAALLYEPRLFESALAVWGFWLVQSAFVLVGGEPAAAPQGDDFERASAALDALLRTPR